MELALDLREERDVLVGKARNMLDHAEKAGTALTGEKETEWRKYMADVETLEKRIAMREKLMSAENYSKNVITPFNEIRHNNGQAPGKYPAECREAFVGLDGRVAHRTVTDPSRIKSIFDRAAQIRSFFNPDLNQLTPGRMELRASPLQADQLTAGGATFQAEQFVAELIRLVDDETFIRKLARVIPCTTSDSLGAPAQKANPDDADWTGEITKIKVDVSTAFEKRQLHPHILSKEVLVSDKLIRTSAIPIEAYVGDRLAYKFGVTQEKGFLTGLGAAGQPLGIMTPSQLGIDTSRDVTASATTSWTADDLISVYGKVKAQYMRSGVWCIHRDGLIKTRKLKDGNGQYLIPTGLNNFAQTPGTFESLLNRPLYMSEYMPNTYTTGKYVAFFGDVSKYWIAEALSMTLKRLIELYAESNEVAFIGVMDIDGMPVLAEAFARLILA